MLFVLLFVLKILGVRPPSVCACRLKMSLHSLGLETLPELRIPSRRVRHTLAEGLWFTSCWMTTVLTAYVVEENNMVPNEAVFAWAKPLPFPYSLQPA